MYLRRTHAFEETMNTCHLTKADTLLYVQLNESRNTRVNNVRRIYRNLLSFVSFAKVDQNILLFVFPVAPYPFCSTSDFHTRLVDINQMSKIYYTFTQSITRIYVLNNRTDF